MLVEGHRPLPAEGVKCTSVQNPLASLRAEAARLAIAALPGPTVLAGHSGMIVTDLAVDPKVTALVYVAARAPDAGEDYTALAKTYPTHPATAGIVRTDQLSAAFLHDFAGDLPPLPRCCTEMLLRLHFVTRCLAPWRSGFVGISRCSAAL